MAEKVLVSQIFTSKVGLTEPLLSVCFSLILSALWANSRIDYGDNGLKRLDQLVKLAETKGIKLIFALTNNWADYGGMDVYTVNLGGRYHDDVSLSIG